MSDLWSSTARPTARLILRDGSSAGVRPASPADRAEMVRFFEHLSPASRRLRFLAAASPSQALIERLCNDSNPRDALALVVLRRVEGETRIVGVGSYFATGDNAAEVAFAVDDDFHRRGIATALLEHLARLGTDQNFDYFFASVLPENSDMLGVFRDSGFDAHSETDEGVVEVRLSLTATPAT